MFGNKELLGSLFLEPQGKKVLLGTNWSNHLRPQIGKLSPREFGSRPHSFIAKWQRWDSKLGPADHITV